MAIATTVACAVLPRAQELVVVLLNLHAACSMLSMELLFPFSARTPFEKVKVLFKSYRWQLAGFGCPILMAIMIPGGGVFVWTHATGAAAYLHYQIRDHQVKRQALPLHCCFMDPY